MSDSLQPHGLQHARLPCPSLIFWSLLKLMSIESVMASSHLILCHPLLPSIFTASGSFPVSWLFTSGGQSIGISASASVLLVNIQDWFPLALTGLIFLLSKGLSGVFSRSTVWKHQFFTQSFLWPNFHICPWLLEKPLGDDVKKQVLILYV